MCGKDGWSARFVLWLSSGKNLCLIKTWSTRKNNILSRARSRPWRGPSFIWWTSHRNGGGKTITAHFVETIRHCGQPMHSMHSGSVALGGPQTNSSSLQSGLLSAKATPESNTYRNNLRSRGSPELGPIGLTMPA